jgi:hypothetical protein
MALYTLLACVPFDPAIEAFRIIEPPSAKRGNAFCTVKSAP